MPLGQPITIEFWLDPITGEQIYHDPEERSEAPGQWHKHYGFVRALRFETTGDAWPELDEWHTEHAALRVWGGIYADWDPETLFAPSRLRKYPEGDRMESRKRESGMGPFQRALRECFTDGLKDQLRAQNRAFFGIQKAPEPEPRVGGEPFWRRGPFGWEG